jgi:hypothetical protein
LADGMASEPFHPSLRTGLLKRMSSTTTHPLEAQTTVSTPDGPMALAARSRGDRWAVTVRCAGRSGAGVGANLGAALLGALELCEAHATHRVPGAMTEEATRDGQ